MTHVQASRSRLFKEFKEVQRDKKDTDIVLFPDESNIYRWTAYIKVSNVSRLRLMCLVTM